MENYFWKSILLDQLIESTVDMVISLTTYQKPLFCRFTRNSSCPGISPRCCLAHIIAKSYHFRTVIQLSRCTRENIPQGVTFKTPIFVRFFKTFFKKLKVCSVAQKRPSLGRHFESLKKRLFLKLFYFRLNCTTKKAVT